MKKLFVLENLELSKSKLDEYVNILNDNDTTKNKKRNVIDEFDMVNITFELKSVNMLQYTILSTIRNIKINKIDRDDFDIPDLNTELKAEYYRLISKFDKISSMLSCKYSIPKSYIEYFEPMTKLVNIKISMTLKEFLEFIKTCNKYDELIDISVAINDNDVVNKLFTVLSYVKSKELFLRNNCDDEQRNTISDYGKFKLLSNLSFIRNRINNYYYDVKVSNLAFGSFVAFRNLSLTSQISNVRLENPKHVLDFNIDVILPDNIEIDDEEDVKIIDKYIYEWILFNNKVKNYTDDISTILMCKLGCFGNVFMINSSFNRYKLLKRKISNREAKDIITNIIDYINGYEEVE